jgi:hypothetical protein
VLNFTFQAHSMRHTVWGGTLVIDIADLDKVVAFANEFLKVGSIYVSYTWPIYLLRRKQVLIVKAATDAA